ncbi:PLC-like phosphodiesterase [Cylindrobasidium torrendii FP15055 ss-10]|uniref:PLC-like phosphodiesterase n=1 Tax=Cylindrobasidium torrendii FP15055 ss-10 TaxID=1314674 RepID=A0A0D7BF35_9AGAR|nr:PLC-like phosphodiesterase [Cylindrobasidium torrendii FP15055 ss-10]
MRFSSNFLAQAASALLLSSGCQAASVQRRADTCNGYSELCDRSYGNVSFVGAHNSYAVDVNNLFANQDYDVTQQLKDGIRLLQLQVHNNNNVLQLCHSECSFYNGGTLEDYLKKVKTWMDANTNDVVTIVIVNSDGFAASDFASVYESAGVSDLSYAPDQSTVTYESWPTLGMLVDNGKRLVSFLASGADFSSVPYLIDEFTNVWETAYDVTDTTFDCEVNRTKGDSGTQLYMINHFLDKLVLGTPAPDISKANLTNSVSETGGLGIQSDTCTAQYGRPPNFMLVDFYEYGGGSIFEVAATNNKVEYTASSIATPKPTSSSSSSSGSGDGALALGVPGLWVSLLCTIFGVGAGMILVV